MALELGGFTLMLVLDRALAERSEFLEELAALAVTGILVR